MSLTLREVLDLDPLRSGKPRVLAGGRHLDRPVRWVHVAELADIAYLLRGGELLLTTGMGIAGSAELQHRYIAELAGAGAAGLVVELGRNFARVPDPMVRSAEEHDLPLVALERETRFVEVTESVHRAIISRQYEQLRRAEGVSRELTELILSGASVGEVVGRLAELFGSHVVLEDAAHQVVEVAGDRSTLATVLADWEEHSRVGHRESARGRVHRHEGTPRCIWVALWLRHDAWGRLHVIESGRRLDDFAELLVDRAGAALGLALLSEKDAAHLADRAGSALIGELVTGRHVPADEFLHRARSLGADLRSGRIVAVALECGEAAASGANNVFGEQERLRSRLSMAEDVREAAAENGCPVLAALYGDRVIAILALPGPRPVPEVVEVIVASTNARRKHPGGLHTIAGASGEVGAGSLTKAIEEATTALAFARRSPGGGVCHYADLGTYQLLSRLAQGPELARFVESELRELLDHDSQTRSKLLPTLRSYLEHAGRKSDTVRALGVQRRTLYGRLAKIESLLGRDLESQDTRTRLTLALHGLDLLYERRARHAL